MNCRLLLSDLAPLSARFPFHRETAAQFLADPKTPARKTDYWKALTAAAANERGLWAGWTPARVNAATESFRKLTKLVAKHGLLAGTTLKLRCNVRGRLRLIDGHHRLGIMLAAQFPGNTWVECEVEAPELEESVIRPAYSMYAGEVSGKKLYSRIDHPLFREWEYATDPAPRAMAIYGAMLPGQTVVDIGTNHGGIAFALAAHGMKVTGLEIAPKYCSLAQALHETLYWKLPVEFRRADAWAMPGLQQFDWCLCLSVLHHEAKRGGKALVRARIKHIQAFARRGAFVEMASKNETQMDGTDVPQMQEHIAEYIGAGWEPILTGIPGGTKTDQRWVWRWLR